MLLKGRKEEEWFWSRRRLVKLPLNLPHAGRVRARACQAWGVWQTAFLSCTKCSNRCTTLHPCSATLCWVGIESGIVSAPSHPMGRGWCLQSCCRWGEHEVHAGAWWLCRNINLSLAPLTQEQFAVVTGLEGDSNLRGQEGASCCTDAYMEIIW